MIMKILWFTIKKKKNKQKESSLYWFGSFFMRNLIWFDMEIIKLSEVRSGEECLIHKVEVEDNAKHKSLCELGFWAGLKV